MSHDAVLPRYRHGVNTIAHESPIEIIRRHPPLSAELARLLAASPIPGKEHVTVHLVSNDASNVVPAQFTADMVTMVRDRETNDPLLLIVVEPQGRSEDEKTFSWPAYLGNLREAHRCRDALLIVVCWNENEAAKCRRAIPLGHPGFVLEPIVIGPKSGPCKVRQALEVLMKTAEYKIDYFDKFDAQVKAKDLLKILKFRGIDLTEQQLHQVNSCTDPEQADLWIDRALDDGASAEAIFKE